VNKKGMPSVTTPDDDTIVAEIEVDAPPQRVFKALTDQGELVH
jgi:uncharacterized protein YndB with AHSA1/START domain